MCWELRQFTWLKTEHKQMGLGTTKITPGDSSQGGSRNTRRWNQGKKKNKVTTTDAKPQKYDATAQGQRSAYRLKRRENQTGTWSSPLASPTRLSGGSSFCRAGAKEPNSVTNCFKGQYRINPKKRPHEVRVRPLTGMAHHSGHPDLQTRNCHQR